MISYLPRMKSQEETSIAWRFRYGWLIFSNVQITDSKGKEIYTSKGKEEDDFIYNFEAEHRLTFCASSSKKETIDLSFRYQIGNDAKPVNKQPRDEYVTSSTPIYLSDVITIDDVNNLADKLQSISTEIYAMQDEQRYTTEKQHNYREGMYLLRNAYE